MEKLFSTAVAILTGKVIPALIITVVGFFVIHAVMKLFTRALAKSKLERAAHGLLIGLTRVVLFLLLGMMVAEKLGVNVSGVVALASVASLAISLSLQDVLSNVISGFTLLSTHPFKAGDFVEIGGQSGTVTEIGLTYTRIATADNRMVSIPNSAVIAAQIVNYSVTGTRRVDITVSAGYDTPVETALEALLEAAKVPTALDTPAPFAGVKNYGDSAIEYVLQVWTNSDDYWTTLFTANQAIKTVFDEKGVILTYPHLNVHLDQ